MSIGLGELTTRARDRIHAGDLAGAEELLGTALAQADPSPATATEELALAAALQAKVLVALGEAHGARGWASYAYAAASRLFGAHDPRTTDAATTLAAVLHRVGAHERAARLYHDVILELSAAEGPESARVLAAHADLATVEYARGDCATARTRLEDAWELHRELYGDGHPAGIRMLARLGAMERDCGRLAESHAHLALAQELCRVHLDPDHPLTAQVSALARAAANPDHVCAVEDSHRVATDTGPPPPRSPISPAGPGYARPFTPPPAAPAGPRHAAADDDPEPFSAGTDLRDAYASEAYPPEDDPWTVPGQRRAPEPPPWPPAWPDDPEPAGHHHDPDPDAGPPPAGWAADDWSRDPGTEDWRRDPQPEPPPSPWARPASAADRHAEAAPDRELASGPAAGRTDPPLPERRVGDRLPVPYPRPRRRRPTPLLIAAVVVAVLGAAAVIAGFALVDGTSSGTRPPAAGLPPVTAPTTAPPATTPSTTAPAPPPTAKPGTPPADVRLDDGRDRVTLRWTYPPGVDGAVVVSAAREGQRPRPFQQLPAGTTSYVVYGLDTAGDYCFVVGVVYSSDVVGSARPVCTRRG